MGWAFLLWVFCGVGGGVGGFVCGRGGWWVVGEFYLFGRWREVFIEECLAGWGGVYRRIMIINE